ncbi:MAG: hypothetical protein ACRDZ5_04325 [Acidimicrobiales bacterium]
MAEHTGEGAAGGEPIETTAKPSGPSRLFKSTPRRSRAARSPEDSFTPLPFTDAIKQVFSPLSSRLGSRSAGGNGAGGNGGGRATGARRARARPAFGTEEERVAVTYIDRRERFLGFFLGAVVIVFTIVVYSHSHAYVNPKRLHYAAQVRHAAPELLAAGLVLGAIVLGATASRRRAALGFGLLLAGIGLLQIVGVIALVYLGVGIWMVFRSMKRSKGAREQRAARGEPSGARGAATGRAGQGSRTPARSRPGTTSRQGSPRSSSSRARGAGSSRPPAVGPAPSKRYTPPKLQKRPPGEKSSEASSTGGSRLTSWLRK